MVFRTFQVINLFVNKISEESLKFSNIIYKREAYEK